MRAFPLRRPATPPVASRRAGALVFALALPACVLSEESSGIEGGATTGAADAMPVPTDAGSEPSTATTGLSDDADESTGPRRDDDPWTGGDEPDTGRPEDLPDPGSTTSAETTSGPTVFGDDCCTPSEGVGCWDPEVQACVCDHDPYCCETAWDDVCVDLMIDAGCLECDVSNKLVPETCCAATGEPGCPEDDVSACVCAVDPFCCDVAWDDTCVGLVDEHACGSCVPPPPPACCEPTTDPGCPADLAIEACVCASDSFCCESQWDNLCASGVQTLECGDCGWTSEGGGCCEANGTPGCDDPDIEACVCPGDPFCCQTSWDSLCAEDVVTYGCGVCPIEPGTGTGTGETGDLGGSDTGVAMTSYGTGETG